MSRHAGSAVCVNAARRALINRLGFVEVWFREKQILIAAHKPVTVIRDQRSKERNGRADKRRWYAAPDSVAEMRALLETGFDDARIARLMRGPKEELERELALAALSGRREEQEQTMQGFMTAQSALQTSQSARPTHRANFGNPRVGR